MDADLFDALNQEPWFANKSRNTFYACTNRKQPDGTFKQVKLHREIFKRRGIKVPRGYTIDHKNRNGLHNHGNNLRLATRKQQTLNRRLGKHELVGVTRNRRLNKWIAQICHEYKKIHLGVYSNKHRAAAAYDFVAKHIDPEFYLFNKTGIRLTKIERTKLLAIVAKHQLR